MSQANPQSPPHLGTFGQAMDLQKIKASRSKVFAPFDSSRVRQNSGFASLNSASGTHFWHLTSIGYLGPVTTWHSLVLVGACLFPITQLSVGECFTGIGIWGMGKEKTTSILDATVGGAAPDIHTWRVVSHHFRLRLRGPCLDCGCVRAARTLFQE
jgi:hypothetical protein